MPFRSTGAEQHHWPPPACMHAERLLCLYLLPSILQQEKVVAMAKTAVLAVPR